jgi:hypothetical protein
MHEYAHERRRLMAVAESLIEAIATLDDIGDSLPIGRAQKGIGELADELAKGQFVAKLVDIHMAMIGRG